MKKLAAIIISTAAVLACLGLVRQQPVPASSQSSQSPWVTNTLTHIVKSASQSLAPRSQMGAYCVDFQFIHKTKPIGLPVNYPVINSSCALYTSFGIADGNYLHEHGEKYAGLVPRRASVYHWLPNSHSLIEIRNSGSSKHFRIYPDFINNHQPNNVNGTFNTYQLGANYILAVNSANLPINVDTGPLYASTNNKWALAFSPSRGSVRINLDNGQTLIFGISAKPTAFAVSDNGRYAAAYYAQSKQTHLYDLDSCVQVSANVNNPWECQSRDITGYINDNFGQINKVERFKFLGPDHLELFLNQTQGEETVYTTVQLTSSGQPLSSNRSYIAMGDSFASGEGDMDDSWYEVGTDEPENKCHLSRRSYPYLINQFLQLDEFHSVACSGAVSSQIREEIQYEIEPKNNSLDNWFPGILPQIDFIESAPQFSTVSIGGNDIGFKSKLINCLLPTTCNFADDVEWRTDVAKEIVSMYKTLVETYKEIVARTGGKTKIFIIGYPQIASVEGGCGLNVHLDQAERKFVFEATNYMNQVIATAAANAGVYYLDTEQALDGYNLCSNAPDGDMAVNGLSFSNSALLGLDLGWMGLGGTRFLGPGVSESFHPNHNGHQLLSNNILDLTSNNPLLHEVCEDANTNDCPQESAVPIPNSAYWGEEAVAYANSIGNPAVISVVDPPKHKKLIVEDAVNADILKIFVTNLEPNSTVRLEIHSEPITLGEFVANEGGLLEIAVPVPQDVGPGFHTLRLHGTETTGDPVEYYEHILVPGPPGDVDNDDVPDIDDPCGFVNASGTDSDKDGIDDACDGFIKTLSTGAATSNESGVQDITDDQQANVASQAVTSSNEPVVYVSTGHNSASRSVVVNDEGDGSYVKSLALNVESANNANSEGLPVAWIWFVVAGFGLIALSYFFRRYSANS